MKINGWLVLIVALFLALGIYYSITTPIFETPDEVWHFAYMRELALFRRLPVVGENGVEPYRHEGLQPPLYYAIGSVFISWMSETDLPMPTPNPYARIGDPRAQSDDNRNAFLHSADEDFPFHGTPLAVHLIRWYSLLLGVGTLIGTFLLAREIFPQTPTLAYVATTVVAFLPQFIFISSAISNDNLATLLTVVTLWQLTVVMRRGLSWRRIVFIGVLTGAGLLTKLTTIALAPLVILALAYPTLKNRNWRNAILSTIIIGAIVGLCAGWWYIRNWLVYGDLTTFGRLAMLVGERARPLNFLRWVSSEGEGLRLSMWGVFGWFDILASQPFYLFFDALAAIGVIGMIVALFRRWQLSMRLAILPIWCTMIFVSFWGYASIIVTSQGRLLFPALPAYAILWSWGVSAFLPPQWYSRVVFGIGVVLAAVAAIVPSMFIAPACNKPYRLAENSIPLNIIPLSARFDNGLEWIGATVDQSTLRPGDSLAVTVYQSIPASDVSRTALFIHVVNSSDVIIAQRDSFIGNGNLNATDQSAMIADTYNILIPLTVPVPDQWRIEIGLYDPATNQRLIAHDATSKSLGDAILLKNISADVARIPWGYDFDGHATLDAAEFSQTAVARGGTMSITLHWRNLPIDARKYNVFVHALGENDQTWASTDLALDPTRPMKIDLRFNPNTPPGVYPLELGIYPPPEGDRVGVFDRHGQEGGDRIFLGPIRVIEP